jgi:hypothetical protein
MARVWVYKVGAILTVQVGFVGLSYIHLALNSKMITMSNELKLSGSLSFGNLDCFYINREGNKKFNNHDMNIG